MSNLGGGFPGVAPTLIGGGAGSNGGSGMVGSSERSIDRFSLVQAWNGAAATGTINGYQRQIGPFRAVNNAGDFLSRPNYTSGGSNQVNNVRTVNRNYNDYSFGGDQFSGSQSAWRRVHRF